MAPVVRRLYDQMLEPKWVMAMGACSSSGGMFANYAVVQGADKFMPVDIYVPGCPPRPEAVLYGFTKLQRQIHGQPRPGLAPALRRQRDRGVGARRPSQRTQPGGRGGLRGSAARAEEQRPSGSSPLPDAPGLELIRGEIERDCPGAVLATSFDRTQAALIVDPDQVLDVLRWLKEQPGQRYDFLSCLHAADYLPAEPRFAVHYELINRDRVERIRVKAMLEDRTSRGWRPVLLEPTTPRGVPEIDSCVELFPTAEAQEREVFDFFGIVFRGHPNLTRILLPDDYVGWPQRRDFPVGGEPVTFTYSEPL